MKDQHKLFAERYAIHGNATQAYKEAGYKCSDHSAESKASRLLRNGKVQQFLKDFRDKASEANGLSMDWVVKRLMWLADTTIDEVLDITSNGVSLKDFSTLDRSKKFAVSEIVEIIRDNGSGQQKIKIADKKGPLELLWKHLGGTEHFKVEDGPSLEVKRFGAKELVIMGMKKGKK